MTPPILSHTGVSPVAALLAAMVLAFPLPAAAQPEASSATPVAHASAVETAEFESISPVQRQIGDATRSLLTMQRDGDVASPTPRPLAGDVASLSYQRYLDSFKHAIPEKFTTTVSKSGGGGN